MKLFSKIANVGVAIGAAAATSSAFAGAGMQAQSNDAFYDFWQTVDGWTSGPLGVGLATTMLLMGGAIGVSKNTPMPALSGIAGGAFLTWGPDIIVNLMTGGVM